MSDQAPASDPGLQAAPEWIREEWARMERAPCELRRPVVVASGWRAWWILPRRLAGDLRRLTGATSEMIRPFSYQTAGSFPEVRRRLVGLVDEAWPSPGGERTTEVDVVAVSMGGLAARYAASGLDDNPRRLGLRRLFTMATPHRGARLAQVIRPDAAASDMRPGSDFLARLDAALQDADYELICYARLGDGWVGATRTAPPGRDPLWRRPASPFMVHLSVSMDAVFITDIARRLRGEAPLAAAASPPPRD